MKKWGFLAIYCCLLVVSAHSFAAAEPAVITDVQYWLAPDHVQTIIFFDRAVQPSYHTRSNPDRFVLEIANTKDLFGDRSLDVNDVTLQRIRVQRLETGTTQVVFDLSRPAEATVQVLPGLNDQSDRVIVNLFDQVAQEQAQEERIEQQQAAQEFKEKRHHIVVLDPGHGGHDPGATSANGLKEKDLVLDFAKRIKAILEQNVPNVKVYLTRDRDYFLPLPKRTEIAKEYEADLFISLHVNANTSKKAQGFSVYTLSEKASDDAAALLAEQENASDILFGGAETPLPLKNDQMLTFVLADLSMTASLQHSLEFGRISLNTALANLKKYGIAREGLKRANFVVLRSAEMPAVLVEACYISNNREEKLLDQKDFRHNIAASIANSIKEYFAEIGETRQTPQMAAVYQQEAKLDISNEPGDQQRMHVVRNGESLSLIAEKYHIDLAQLRQANQLASADMIYVGQQLWIP